MKRILVILLGLLAATFQPELLADVGTPVDQVRVQNGEGFRDIVVTFLWPINLQGHSPQTGTTDHLTVQLGVIPGDGAIVAGQAMLPWRTGSDPAGKPLYRNMALDGDWSGATLEVDFVAPVTATVQRGGDPRQLVIRVADSALADAPPAAGDQLAAGEKLQAANRALADEDYGRAIALYTQIAADPDDADRAAALELLGVARERKGQLAQAKAAYEEYLQWYPGTEGAARVQQRLDALLSVDRLQASGTAPAAQAGAGRAARESSGWDVYGGWSQYYRYADFTIDRNGPDYDDSDSDTVQSDLLSRLDLTARRDGVDWAMETRFGGGYLYDLLDEEDAGGRHDDDILLSNASVELTHKASDSMARLGRQYSNGKGVLGRFDGLDLEYAISDAWRLGLVGGRPVDLVYDTTVDSSERWFYGFNAALAPVGSDWEYGVFAVEQRVDGMRDRQAVGGEIRYFADGTSLFTLVDYDLDYGELNTFLLNGNVTTGHGTIFGVILDWRLSPVLTTRNALIGQEVDSIDELRDLFGSSEVRQLAEDRTADSHYVTLTVTQPLTERWQLYGAVSEYEYGSTESSGGVEGFEGTGSEYGYELQLIANELFTASDSQILSLRHFDGEYVQRTRVGINSRFLVGDGWRLQPRLWLEYRDNSRDDSEQWSLAPSLRVQYRWARRYHIELEAGRDWANRDFGEYGEEDTGGTYALMSYRIDF